MKIQQIFLDLGKAKMRKIHINQNELKNVYKILSENKTSQIIFIKAMKLQENKTQEQSTLSPSSLSVLQPQFLKLIHFTYRRVYSRLIECTIKKLTYYILNKSNLYKVILSTIIEITKKFQTIIRRLNDFKDAKMLYQIVNIIYEENSLLEKQIYQVLVNEGYVVSIEQFFRINGILMEQKGFIKRGSRINTMPINIDQQILLNKSSRRSEGDEESTKQNKSIKQRKRSQYSKKTYIEKNMTYIDRVHKDIEFKYAIALDKIGEIIAQTDNQKDSADLMQNESQKLIFDQDNIFEHDESNNQKFETNFSPFERWKMKNQKKRSTVQKRPSSFQYFSSGFKQVIRKLDQKKGKTLNGLSTQNQNLNINNKINKKQRSQLQKINHETISMQNPLTMARMLQKKFKTYSPGQFPSMNKTRLNHQNQNPRKQINKLLKIYESTNKQHNNINILFESQYIGEQGQKLQKNFIILSIFTKLKEQRFASLKERNVLDDFQSTLMKHIEEEYEKLLNINLKKGSKGNIYFFDSMFKTLETNVINNFNMNALKKKKIIDIEKQYHHHSWSDSEYQIKQTQNFNEINCTSKFRHSQQQTERERIQRVTNLSKTCVIQKNSPLQRVDHKHFTFRPQNPNIDQIQPSQLLQLKNMYGQFSNPLTKRSGYYGMKEFTSLRNSLQKSQINKIKQKKGILKKNQQLIRQKFALYKKKSNGKVQVQQDAKYKMKLNNKENNDQVVNKFQKNTHPDTESKPGNQSNFFQHKLIQKYLNQNYESVNSQQIMKPQQKRLLSCQDNFNSRNQKNNTFDSLKIKQNIIPNSSCASGNKYRSNIQDRKSLGKDFCFNSQKIRQPNVILALDDLDILVEKIMERKQKISSQEKKSSKQHSKAHRRVQSVINIQRTLHKKHTQLYSTQRRVKIF